MAKNVQHFNQQGIQQQQQQPLSTPQYHPENARVLEALQRQASEQQQQHQLQQQQQLMKQQQQQQRQDQESYKCNDCGLFLNSAESLEVHVKYHHNENLMQAWAQQSAATAASEEANNNSKQIKRELLESNSNSPGNIPSEVAMKKSPEYSNRPSPEQNSGGFGQPPTPQSYHSASSPYQNQENSSFSPGFQNFQQQIKIEQSSPTHQFNTQHHQPHHQPFYQHEGFYNLDNSQGNNLGNYNIDYHSQTNKMPSQSSNFRYNPYQYERNQVASSSPAYLPQPTPSPSPKHCDKCSYVCNSAAQLTEHITANHPTTPASGQPGSYQNNFLMCGGELKSDEQSEILDLDSHKVHQVYSDDEKRNNGEIVSHTPHSVSSLLNPWSNHQAQPSPTAKIFGQDQRMFMNEGIPDAKMFDQHKLFPGQSEFVPNGLEGPPHDMLGTQGYRPPPAAFDMPPQPSPVLPNNQVPVGPPQPPPSGTKSTNWKSNEARRPKTYNCTACNKWFTSSGHLKRHYNTTLHKNAVKSSGQPDPATMPISAHHHPARDQNNRNDDQSSNSPREESRNDEALVQRYETTPNLGGLLQQPPNGPYDRQPAPNIHQHPGMSLHHPPGLQNLPGSPPNGEAGPSAYNLDSRGLLSVNNTLSSSSTITSPTSSSTGLIQPMMMPPQMEAAQFQMYPNGDAPHVTQQVTINNLSTTGDDQMNQEYAVIQTESPKSVSAEEANQALPSFAQYFTLGNYSSTTANVGGPGPATAPYTLYTAADMNTLEAKTPTSIMQYREDEYKLAVLTVQDASITSLNEQFYTFNNNNNNVMLTGTDGMLIRPGMITAQFPNSPEDSRTYQGSSDFEELPSPPLRPSPAEQEAARQQGIHKCYDCNRIFNKSCYLTQHNKTFHSGDKPYKCARCGKRFSCEEQYNEHLTKHAGDKPHKCDLCPKQFNHKTDLRRHMCLHTGAKPFACEDCGKGFIRKDHMLKHRETHTKKPATAVKVAAVRWKSAKKRSS